MSQDIFRKILDDHKKLTSLPQILVEVIRVANNSETSIAELSNVINRDPGLSTKLLRVVNSPFYSPTNEITTISQAVSSLGMRTVTAFALSSSIYELVSDVNGSIDRKKFWRHSLEVAMIARKIAEAVGYQPTEEAFTAGLLHDIGSLIMEASFPDRFKTIWKQVDAGKNLIDLEESFWNTNHARAGQFMLNQWHIPKVISEAVGEHHLTINKETDPLPGRLSLIINLANFISRFRIYNMPLPESDQLANKKNLAAELDLSHSALFDIERNIISDVVTESGYLEINIGSIEDILRDSNELLYNQYMRTEKLLQEKNEIQRQIRLDPEGQKVENSLKEAINVFGQLVNEFSSVILMRIDWLNVALEKKHIIDDEKIVSETISSISESVDSISTLIKEMGKISTGKSLCNHDFIADLKTRFNRQIKNNGQIEKSVS